MKRKEFEKLDINNVGFKTRVLTVFDNYGIQTGKDLLKYKMSELKEFKGFGLGCEKDVEFVLEEYEQELQFEERHIQV